MTYFVTIAEIGSFRAAGERLFIAQPALTVSIRRLEEALGTRLFERHARGVSLTPAGEAFLVYARRSLGYAELAQENARRAASGGWGTVKLGFLGQAVHRIIPKLTADFTVRHAGLKFDLSEGTIIGITHRLLDGSLDVGIVRKSDAYDVTGLTNAFHTPSAGYGRPSSHSTCI